MTAPLLSLPNELKQEVIGHLDTQAILSLRLVNKDLLNNVQETQAFENLFEQVTIHLHPQSLELFKAICASPILSKVVKKVSVSILAFSEPPNPSILTEQDHSIFNELVAMEDHYFTHGGASTDLAACLEELPSCSSITLVQKLGMFKEKSKCLKLFQRMLLPLEATERYQDRVHGSSDDRTMYGNVHYRNDILSSVLRSIARDTMFIHEFVLETEYEDLYILEDLAPPLLPHEISTAAFANIRTFELQVLDPGSYENDEEILVQLLAGMKHLTHFALIANSGSDRTNSSDLLDALSIPHLKSFRLVGMSFCASHFLDFMRKHADLLKE
ncbi:hypothetical protein EJ08DRAFT_518730 [Tothia fuscella]|uniref:F-box domain-containing protein n=1 Tax=Tothia fuscella TaxID=1048955 RepID=A0A9P4NHG0_9PEZI|nr:hypothetical protein EJ08DRAFT_518730 [Tothia fuscella]